MNIGVKHMKQIIGLTASTFVVLSNLAFAQAPSEPPPLAPENGQNMQRTPAEVSLDDDKAVDHKRSPSADRGARVSIEIGRMRVDLRCADGDTTTDCADAALKILDQLQPWNAARGERRGDERRSRWERD